MNIILLSGGSGKRLWPLSNDIRSKQFIKLFKNKKGEYESMFERMYRGIKDIEDKATITIATSVKQASTIKSQIGEDVNISIEPARRDTFPAIALACAYIHDIKNVSLEETIVVCPIDPYVEEDYFKSIEKMSSVQEESNFNLTLMGIKPTYPSEKYGYIIPDNTNEVSIVKKFKEKPNVDEAKKLINDGALWNGGVFAFKLKYLLEIAHTLIDFDDFNDLFSKYDTLEKISFDYAVVEKEKNIQVVKFDGKWKDLGTWNTLTESMDEKIIGKGILNENCSNTHVMNELGVPVLGMGLKNIVVSASSEGILVSDKSESSYIKPFVDQINQPIMFAEKSWGSYRVIDVQDDSLTVLVTLNKENKMKYHSHDFRNEIWNIISGEGKSIVDGMVQDIKPGDVITIEAGCKHTVIANSELKIVEVQIGDNIDVNDKHKYEDEY